MLVSRSVPCVSTDNPELDGLIRRFGHVYATDAPTLIRRVVALVRMVAPTRHHFGDWILPSGPCSDWDVISFRAGASRPRSI
jgi:hypothetical protein